MKVFILILSIFSSISVSAKNLSEAAFFNRCYIHLTGHPVARDHALMRQLKSGQIKALDACNSLLDNTTLDAITGTLKNSSQEGLWILNNFYSFHRSWFPTTAVEQIQGYGDENSAATRDIYDSTEPSLAVTRSVFASSVKYSDVVTANMGVYAIRKDDPSIKQWSVSFPSRSVKGNNPSLDKNLINFREDNDGNPAHGYDRNSNTTRSHFANMDKIQTGELQGIAPTTKSFTVPNVSLSLLNQVPDLRGSDQPSLNSAFNFYKTFGGGVLGTPIYLMLNFGHGIGLQMNGSTKSPRRWAKAALNNFMCASLPTLRESDISQFLVGNSTAPFRKSSSCLQCHATMDQMAYTARNLVMTNSDEYPTNNGDDPVKKTSRTALMLTSFKADLPSVKGWPSEPVANFQRQTPIGVFYTRLFSGQLVNQPLNGISDLGAAIAATDDYYQCAAKRYFEFLTGIQVPLYDRTNPANADLNKALNSDAIADRKFVESLAEELKKNQSIKELIKNIFASDYYKNSNFRP